MIVVIWLLLWELSAPKSHYYTNNWELVNKYKYNSIDYINNKKISKIEKNEKKFDEIKDNKIEKTKIKKNKIKKNKIKKDKIKKIIILRIITKY